MARALAVSTILLLVIAVVWFVIPLLIQMTGGPFPGICGRDCYP